VIEVVVICGISILAERDAIFQGLHQVPRRQGFAQGVFYPGSDFFGGARSISVQAQFAHVLVKAGD